jgi:hypothetical protein
MRYCALILPPRRRRRRRSLSRLGPRKVSGSSSIPSKNHQVGRGDAGLIPRPLQVVAHGDRGRPRSPCDRRGVSRFAGDGDESRDCRVITDFCAWLVRVRAELEEWILWLVSISAESKWSLASSQLYGPQNRFIASNKPGARAKRFSRRCLRRECGSASLLPPLAGTGAAASPGGAAEVPRDPSNARPTAVHFSSTRFRT